MTWIRFKYDTLKMEMKNAGVCSSLAHLRQFLQNPKWFQAALRFWQPRAANSPLWGEGKRVQAASSPLTLSREQSPRGRHRAQHSKDWWPRRRSVAPTGWETGTKTTWTMEGAFPSSAPASNSSSSGTGSLQVQINTYLFSFNGAVTVSLRSKLPCFSSSHLNLAHGPWL